MSTASTFARLDARDRALFHKLSLTSHRAPRRSRVVWTAITHAGGLYMSSAAAFLPLLAHGAVYRAALLAVAGLSISHVAVQLIKRSVGRPRPSRHLDFEALVFEPPCFSFPSGHATAAMSVAFMYAAAFPSLAVVLLPIALAVGFSRVRLGVHYPGDVMAGQLIAVITDVVLLMIW